MQALIGYAKETSAAVALIHHAGKDASKGARGHSSLRGAVDTQATIEMSPAAPKSREVVVDLPAVTLPTREPLKYFWACDVQPVLDGQFVVKGIIQVGTLIVVFGESNSGKTFFVLDLVLAIAGGQFWRGRKVMRGLVVYIGEGSKGCFHLPRGLRHGLLPQSRACVRSSR